MKINLWVKKEDAISGQITKYFTNETQIDGIFHNYVQVSISSDEFARLEDKDYEETFWIYERNPDTDTIRKRIKGDYGNEINIPKESALHKIYDEFPEYKDMKLGDFQEWYDGLSEDRRNKFSELQQNVQDNKRK